MMLETGLVDQKRGNQGRVQTGGVAGFELYWKESLWLARGEQTSRSKTRSRDCSHEARATLQVRDGGDLDQQVEEEVVKSGHVWDIF